MNIKNKRLLAAVLTVCLIIAQLPVTVFAAEDGVRDFSSYSEYMDAIGIMCANNNADFSDTYTVDLSTQTVSDDRNEMVVDYDDNLALALTADDVNDAAEMLKDTPYKPKKIKNDKFSVDPIYQTKRLIVIVEDGETLKNTCKAIDVVHYGNEYILQFATEKDTEKAMKKLSKTKHVVSVELDVVFYADALSNMSEGEYMSWGIKAMGLDKFQDALNASNETLPTIIVAVLDTGVTTTSPYLNDRLLSGTNYVDSNDNTEDYHGHGSHVAGTICDGTTNNVKILPVKVLGDDGSGSALGIRSGIEWAVSQGADVLNMSLGSYIGDSSNISTIILTYYDKVLKKAERAGCFISVSAGNDSGDVAYARPACSPYVVTVGAVDSNKALASFSNTGEELEFVAPGVSIKNVGLNGGVATKRGTSMAAPHIAAAAALMKTTDKSLTQDEIVDIWVNSYVVDLGDSGKDNKFGYGFVNLSNYLEAPCVHNYIANITKNPTCVEDGSQTYTCSNCGDTYIEKISAIGHNYECVTAEATCTKEGSNTYTCVNCGNTYAETIPMVGHNYEAVVTAPTCTTKGYTTYTCECGHSYVADETDMLTHNYECVTVDATCTKEGSHTYTCVNCGDSYVETIPMIGHNYEAVVTAPTCSSKGYTIYTCECGHSYVADETDMLAHNYECVTIDATCTKEGTNTYTCSVCGDSYMETIPMVGHVYNAVVTAPTCSTKGFTTYTCECGHSYVADETDMLAHNYECVTVDATCTKEGSNTYTCSVCGDSYMETIPMIGHVYNAVVTAPTCTEKGFTTYTCECGNSYVADETDMLAHNYECVTVDATCTKEGSHTYTCSNCGDSYVETIPMTEHNYECVTVKATCTKEGTNTYTCSNCGYSYVEVIPVTEHNYNAVVTAPTCTEKGFTTYTCECGNSYVADETDMLAHNYECVTVDATCTKEGSHTYTCSNCGDTYAETIPMTEHNYECVTVKATCTKEGSNTYTCSNCGYSYVEVIPVTEHNALCLLKHLYDIIGKIWKKRP